MKTLNFVRKSPHAKPPPNQKEIWHRRRAERQREAQKARRAQAKAIQLPTDQIASWTPEQWQEFARRIGIKPRS